MWGEYRGKIRKNQDLLIKIIPLSKSGDYFFCTQDPVKNKLTIKNQAVKRLYPWTYGDLHPNPRI
jgi:hypothetical protein